ncbi:MAG: aminotransferase class V-fold PLP-dependent enzyme [Lachnospiraceae bacterium]
MDVNKIRREFPFFQQGEKPLIYFDNGATTQKPQAVISRLVKYYTEENSNIHRGSYPLSNHTEKLYEHARETVARWLDAEDPEEIVFTRGSTEAVNLVAASIGESWLNPGDNVVVTELEHSSNYFPWKHQCEIKNAEFRVAEARKDGGISAESVDILTDEKTRMVAVSAMSNVTGFRPDIQQIIKRAHGKGSCVFIDASQEIVHHRISVRELGCDFLCFSGHKIYGPMGIGVLYGKKKFLEKINPYMYGGDMVEKGDGGCIRYRRDSGKFAAGTQNIAGALGLEAALQFLEEHDFEQLTEYERMLGRYLRECLGKTAGIRFLGTDTDTTVHAFEIEGLGAYDVGVFLGNQGIAVRCGAHCAYPLMRRMGKESACRVSFAFYNTFEEIERLAEHLKIVGRLQLFEERMQHVRRTGIYSAE